MDEGKKTCEKIQKKNVKLLKSHSLTHKKNSETLKNKCGERMFSNKPCPPPHIS